MTGSLIRHYLVIGNHYALISKEVAEKAKHELVMIRPAGKELWYLYRHND